MDTTTLSAAARRFPLLGRPRPACPALPDRLQEITDIAGVAQQHGTLAEGAHALNKAALLASDCGLTDLARDLCWRHISVYQAAGHRLTVREARYMLEPVLNIARLQIRAEAGAAALQLLQAMHQATTANTDLVVEGRELPLANLTGTRHEHRKLREWVWLQYLGEGIRALTLAGRWDEAVAHAKAHKGIGLHLMEGRQAAIIAQCLHGALSTAHAILKESTLTQPWEHKVSSCLNVMCADSNRESTSHNIAAMVGQFLGQEPEPGYTVFRARVGLTVVTLASATDSDAAGRVLTQVATEVVDAGDGYAARDVLGFRSTIAGIIAPQLEALSGLVTHSGLGSGTLPETQLESLTSSAETAEKALTTAIMRLSRPASHR